MRIYPESTKDFTLSKTSNRLKDTLLSCIKKVESRKPDLAFSPKFDTIKRADDSFKTTSTILSIQVTYTPTGYRKERFIALFKQAKPLEISVRRIKSPTLYIKSIYNTEIIAVHPKIMEIHKKLIIKLGTTKSFIHGTGGYRYLA